MTMEHTTEKPMIVDDIFLNFCYIKDQVWDMENDDWMTWWISPLFREYDTYISIYNDIVEQFNEKNNECYLDFDREYYECREDMIEKCKITITKYKVEGDEEEEQEDLRSCDCCNNDKYESGELMVYSNLINTEYGDEWVCLDCSKHPDFEKTYGKNYKVGHFEEEVVGF